ncbi:hypothetical protein LP52_23800 [Streptomonospora alba]|uniref:Uncharacterized protein n=1 Tax=Streptomonospora alba TaxID=183763 RepID=A0A0C2G057_9ACTN|nr:hypothetical protein [Streptomonospora alba]KIH96658.1 hypothetical protein LP52_23800 [Streptomonospora alba]
MKFEVVDPADRPAEDGVETPAGAGSPPSARPGGDVPGAGAAEAAEAAADDGCAADDAGGDQAEDEAEQDPQARLTASTRRLSAQARQGAALVGDSLAKLAHQVAELEVADTGHRPAPAPSSFRADRFGTGRLAGSAGVGEAASCIRPPPAVPGAEVRDHYGTGRASEAPNHR